MNRYVLFIEEGGKITLIDQLTNTNTKQGHNCYSRNKYFSHKG
ncbi:hypothetical protein SAMN04488023_12047 [Pedobacter rhizosphaerae]|uniref:Uncharacterized protein n=1 Tax=Pedobacter rhizosphaerae TaxID=390241 RepID=A0A1H9T1M0_9SPHI|nr:hypothetical protein SAMN04488023_12047 [Pedobacter rhizosphaerae]